MAAASPGNNLSPSAESLSIQLRNASRRPAYPGRRLGLDRLCPGDEVAQSLVEGNAWLPVQNSLGLCDVADVVLLVAVAPAGERVLGLLAGQLPNLIDHLEEVALILRAPADIEDLAAGIVDVLDGEEVDRAQVPRIEQVSHLLAIAKNRQLAVVEDGVDKVGHPSLVLRAVLVGAVNAALAQHNGVHLKAARVVPDVLVGCPFAAAIW